MKTFLALLLALLSTSSFAWLNNCPCLPDPAADVMQIYRANSVEIEYTQDDTIAKDVKKTGQTIEVQ
jgi:hypothetical protein